MNWPGPYRIVFENGSQLCLLAYNENQARLLAHQALPLPIVSIIALQV
jgi:hypothetical protein